MHTPVQQGAVHLSHAMKYTVSIFKRIDVDAIDEEEAALRARERLPHGFDGYQLTVSRGESHHTPTESEQSSDE